MEKEVLQTAVIIAADTGEYDMERSLAELDRLADSAGAQVVAAVVQKLKSADPATYIGSGRLAQAAQLCADEEAQLVIADAELTGAQIRNIEKIVETPVIDRTALILDIFAASAVTAEGKLQVEQAQLRYRLPRLAGSSEGLTRQGGGIGTRGPGETKLESDRRRIRARISRLGDQLEEMSKRREQTRRKRARADIPVVALVGYTNAGKSSLLNALTGAEVLAEDRLFATLDPTLRRLQIADLQQILVADTVGFVSRLPHNLVEAFKSTLEELKYADLILKVVDAADPAWEDQLAVTDDVIAQLGCTDTQAITVFNKSDIAAQPIPFGIAVSAVTGAGLDELKAQIARRLEERVVRGRFLIPYAQLGVSAEIRAAGNVHSEEFVDAGALLTATLPRSAYDRYTKYLFDEDGAQ